MGWYARLRHEKYHHGEQRVLSFALNFKLLRATNTNHGFKLTLSISSFHVCRSYSQDADILPFLDACLHSFLNPIICLKCLIFLLHLLRTWWLLMAGISSDGAFLGEIHFLSVLAGKIMHLLHRTKRVFMRTLKFPIYLPLALFLKFSVHPDYISVYLTSYLDVLF